MKVKTNYLSYVQPIKFYKPHRGCISIAYCSSFGGVIMQNANGVEKKYILER